MWCSKMIFAEYVINLWVLGQRKWGKKNIRNDYIKIKWRDFDFWQGWELKSLENFPGQKS